MAESVALELLTTVAKCEDKTLVSDPGVSRAKVPDRKWILDTYTKCLKAVLDLRDLDR